MLVNYRIFTILFNQKFRFNVFVFRLSDSPELKKDDTKKRKKEHKKHKKHKKSSKNSSDKSLSSKKHKKHKKKHRGSDSSDSDEERPRTIESTTPETKPVEEEVKVVKPLRSMNEKFSELMGLEKKSENGSAVHHKLSQKLKISTDPEELVLQITKSITKPTQTLEILSSESESDG